MEELGFDSFWAADHLTWSNGRAAECWTVLSSLATVTKKLRLGTLVLCNLFRYPSLLAKMGSTLDIASKGRLEFGIGAGWKEDECIMYGIPFPRPRERIERLHEAVQVIQELWHKDVANFKGKYYALTNAVLEPKPIQKPHPPIWIGAKGEKLALPVVAELADGYNTGPCSLEVYAHKVSILKNCCEKIERQSQMKLSYAGRILLVKPKNSISNEQKSRLPADTIFGSPDECASRIREFINLGVAHFQLIFEDLPSTNGIELFRDEVLPLV